MSSYNISSDDLIILRDGRPFGDAGIFGGTSLDWPYPQTLAGMCRSAIGHNCGSKFFENDDNIQEILKISINRILPLLSSEQDEYLLPTPADLIFSDQEGRKVHVLSYNTLKEGEGTDISSPHWLYPTLNIDEKPAVKPKFLRQGFAQKYLAGDLKPFEDVRDEDADFVSGPVMETRIHTAINSQTGSVEEGKLFAESGLYLKAPKSSGPCSQMEKDLSYGPIDHGVLGDIKICFELSSLAENMAMPQSAYLGGERRRVTVEECEFFPYPKPPAINEPEQFLKLLLTTHGDFGTWAPEWLVPNGDESQCDWVEEPRSKVQLRLRSAVLSGWAPVSGWDYVKRGPKPFRKLVCPGSVYLVELRDPSQAESLIKSLWGRSICEVDSQSDRDGYGQVVIAKAMHISEVKESR